MIALDQVTLEQGGRALVSDITLDMEAGKLMAVLGANGAGKTTLLRLMSGEWAPTRGHVRWERQPLHRLDRRALARRRAVLSQHQAAPFAFRAIEVVLLGRLPHARSPGAYDHVVAREAMESAGITPLAERRVHTLSGGERQRVHLARSLAQLHEARIAQSGVLLLDEPTTHLDLAHQARTLALARRLAREGLAVAAVLHDVNLAATFADRVVLMKRGRIIAAGPMADVLTPTQLREAFDVSVDVVHCADGRPVFVPFSSHKP